MKILIIKTGALGDVDRCSFLAQALKDKFKTRNPTIYWITDKRAMSFFVNNPYVDKVIKNENRNSIRHINYDLVLNLEEDMENAKFAKTLSAKKSIGIFLNEQNKIDYTPESVEWFDMSLASHLGKDRADKLKIKNRKTHRQLMSQIVGVDYRKYEPFIRLTNEQRLLANNFLRRHNLSRTNKIIGINTGSAERWPKHLSIKKTAELINKLYTKYRASIILFGGPNELERNKEIIKLSEAPVVDAGCGNDLIEFPALISICGIFITTDTLGLHLALGLKRRTICLIGPTSHHEIDMYRLGEKVIAKSNCLCCYKTDCDSMKKISINEILDNVKPMLEPKVTLVITAFKEPKTIGRSVEAALNQKTRYKYNVIVSAPDDDTLNVVKKYSAKNKNIQIFKDPGKGKSYALNLILQKLESDIALFTDGDVFISKNSAEEITNLFLDPEIGCVSGRPVPVESRKTKYGYWANFLFDAAHNVRRQALENNSFLECSGYLFAFRNKMVKKIPLDVAEDTVIPYFFWEKGYRIGYAENAEVYVKNVSNWKDWVKQKVRTSKAHETLSKYVNTKITPRVKSFGNEARGIKQLLTYPRNSREILWSIQLALARFYMWFLVFYDTKLKNKHYGDNWERAQSAR